MDCRGLVVLSAVLVVGSFPLLPACKGPDPGAITFQERTGGQTTDPTESSSSSSGSSGATDAAAPGDGGATGEGGAGDGFFTTAFALHPTDPPNTVANAHAGTHTGQIPLQGDGTAAAAPKGCVAANCHEGGGTPWIAGGSVFDKSTGGKVAEATKYEIGINKPDGTLLAAVTPDKDGNFWFDVAGPIPDNSTVAIRKEGGKSMVMSTKLTAANKGGNCNSANCHGGPALRIYAP